MTTITLQDHVLPIRDRAIELLEQGWIQDGLAGWKDGRPYTGEYQDTPTPADGGCQWCLFGAVAAALREVYGADDNDIRYGQAAEIEGEFRAEWKLVNGTYSMGQVSSLVDFNDDQDRTKEEVIESLRRMGPEG